MHPFVFLFGQEPLPCTRHCSGWWDLCMKETGEPLRSWGLQSTLGWLETQHGLVNEQKGNYGWWQELWRKKETWREGHWRDSLVPLCKAAGRRQGFCLQTSLSHSGGGLRSPEAHRFPVSSHVWWWWQDLSIPAFKEYVWFIFFDILPHPLSPSDPAKLGLVFLTQYAHPFWSRIRKMNKAIQGQRCKKRKRLPLGS